MKKADIKQAILLRGKEKSLSRRHPWLFSGALKSVDKDIEEGDVVRVIFFASVIGRAEVLL